MIITRFFQNNVVFLFLVGWHTRTEQLIQFLKAHCHILTVRNVFPHHLFAAEFHSCLPLRPSVRNHPDTSSCLSQQLVVERLLGDNLFKWNTWSKLTTFGNITQVFYNIGRHQCLLFTTVGGVMSSSQRSVISSYLGQNYKWLCPI